MPGSGLDGGTYGCMSHVPDLRGLMHEWGRQERPAQRRGTVQQSWGWPLPRVHDSDLTSAYQELAIYRERQTHNKLLCR